MDPVSMISAALTAGALAGTQETASAAVKNAYSALLGMVRQRLRGKPAAEAALAKHEAEPAASQASLAAVLARSEAGADPEVVRAAQALLALVDETGTRAGKYVVEVYDSQGVQVGDGTVQYNTFSGPAR